MRGRHAKSVVLAKDYQEKVVDEGKCRLDGPGDYVPLFRGIDFPSQGNRTLAFSFKTGRPVETMSEPEYDAFLYFESLPEVTRIVEQFGVDPAITREEAKRLGVRHPAIRGEDTVMSIDLVVDSDDERKRRVGYSIKTARNYRENKTEFEERFRIEQAAGRRLGFDVKFLLDTALPRTVVENARYVRPHRSLSKLPCPAADVDLIRAWLWPHVDTCKFAIAGLCRECDRRFGIVRGTSYAVALHLVAIREWQVDMREPIAGHLPLVLL